MRIGTGEFLDSPLLELCQKFARIENILARAY